MPHPTATALPEPGSILNVPLPTPGEGMHVVLLGLGSHGGGSGALRWLLGQGARVSVVDDAPASRFTALLERLEACLPSGRVRWHFGGATCDVLQSAQLLVVNPAIRPGHPLVDEAVQRCIPVTTELGLFLAQCPAPVIGISGTNGKTTTATLTYRTLRRAGLRAWLGGNIGRSLLPHLRAITPTDRVVLEMSSFQLFWLGCCRRVVEWSAVTSFAPDHLDWHPTLEHYRACKQLLLKRTSETGISVLNWDDSELRAWSRNGPVLRVGGSESCDVRIGERSLSGSVATASLEIRWSPPHEPPPRHVRTTMGLAAVLAVAAGATPEAAVRVARAYRAVPHRLQVIGRIAERVFIDDSASTTPHACEAALQWARERWPGSVWLILGGRRKGQSYEQLLRLVVRSCHGVALIGESRHELLREFPWPSGYRLTVASSLDQAVVWCLENSTEGDVILFSPACASTDMYPDYRERGLHFRNLVRELAQRYGGQAA